MRVHSPHSRSREWHFESDFIMQKLESAENGQGLFHFAADFIPSFAARLIMVGA